MNKEKIILDACCGGRMFWYNKTNRHTIFVDNRIFSKKLSNGQNFKVEPDIKMDFRELKFKDNTFKLVVFDPPHLIGAGKTGWLAQKYGLLENNWREYINLGFCECWRVLKEEGVLIFKWNEEKIKLSEILKILPQEPLFGSRPTAHGKTHWLCFMKFL